MERFFGYSRLLSTGAPVGNSTVTVYDVGTLNLATIFSDDLGTPTPKANPFTTDSNGFFYFYAEDGRYDVRQSGGTIPSPYTWGDVLLDDSSGLSFNAVDYGYVASAAVDNAAALAAAHAAAVAAGGGTIYLPEGRGGIGSQFALTGTGVTLAGRGLYATQLVRMSGFTGGLPTIRSQQIYGGVKDLTIDNNSIAGDGLYVFGGNYNTYDRVRVSNVVDDGRCCFLSGAGSNTFRSCLFHAEDGQGFVMENGAPISTALRFHDVAVITSHTTVPAVVLDGALNAVWFGGQISADSGPALSLLNTTGTSFYGLYVETSGTGAAGIPVELESASDITFHGGTYSDNLNVSGVPIFYIHESNSVTFSGNCLIGREAADTTPLIQVETPAAGDITLTVDDVTFRCTVNYTAIEVDGTVPARLVIRQVHDRAAGVGTISVKCRDSYIGQTLMPVELLAGSLQPVTLDGFRGTLTDPDYAANRIGGSNIGITHGAGSPEGVVPANLGHIYINTSGGVGTTMYIKQQNAGGNTGWASVT